MSRSPGRSARERPDSWAILRHAVGGTGVASVLRGVSALRLPLAVLPVMAGGPLAVTAGGCITQDLHFVPPTNYPPSVEVPADGARPFSEVIRLQADQLGGGGDAGPVTSVRLDVLVRDPDVDQELQYKVYVDYQLGVVEDPSIADFLPARPATGSNRRERRLSIDVPIRALREPGCHRIELLVSERFQSRTADATGREPLVEGDLGTGTWWVATQATAGDEVDMTGCP